MTGRLTRQQLVCLVGLALVAGGLVLFGTRQGIVLTADDAAYTGAARSVAAGTGLNVPIHYYPLGSVSIGTPPAGRSAPRPTPLVVYAPLEPVLLAAGGQHPVGAARVEDTIFFVLTVLVVGGLVLSVTGELWLAAAAQLIIALSQAWGPVAGSGTEGPALFFAAVGLAAVVRYRDHPKVGWLVTGSVAVALATVTRYAAGGLIVWGVIALWRRRRAAAAFLVIAVAPVGGWFLYEKISGRSTGHAVGFHVVKTTLRSGLHAVAFWILPTNVPTGLAVLGALVVAVIVVAVLWRSEGSVPWLLVVFAVVQVVVLEVATTFFDAGVTLDGRELLPVFLALVVAVACGVPRTRSVKIAAAVLVVACALRFGIDTGTNPPGGYTTPRWEHSTLLADVRALPAGAVIYSDAPDLIYLLDGRAVSSVPETVDFSTLKVNTRFTAQLEEIRRTLGNRGGYLVYVRGLGRESFLPSEARLRRELSLTPVANTVDGAIYRLSNNEVIALGGR